MSVLELREKLHQYIEVADEEHLSAIYTLVGSDAVKQSNDYVFDEATMQMLNERVERYEKGLSKTYTAEESINMLKQHIKK